MKAIHLKTYILPVSGPDDTEIFAFSDNHGMLKVFNTATKWIGNQERKASKREVVSLGDIIDRGPDSGYLVARGAFARKDDIYKPAKADKITEIIGNHEQFFLISEGILHPTDTHIVEHSSTHNEIVHVANSLWRRNKGSIYQQQIREVARKYRTWNEKNKILKNWFSEMKPIYTAGQILFVHAGLDRRKTVEQILMEKVTINFSNQIETDTHWAWSGNQFISRKNLVDETGFFVMHGHTCIDEESNDLDVCFASGRMNHDNRAWVNKSQRVSRIVGNKMDIFDIYPDP